MAFQKKRIAVMLFFTAFWFYLFYVLGTVELSLTVAVLEIGMGIAGAALIFTLFRCVITPLFFGRAFCSWICWSPGLFDLFGQYKSKTNLKKNKWLYLKYAVAAIMIFFGVRSLLAGNVNFPTREVSMMKDISVITLGLLLAFPFGHRWFCRYACPPGSLIAYFSRWGLLKVEGDTEKCRQCGTCEINCPMGVSAKKYIQSGERICNFTPHFKSAEYYHYVQYQFPYRLQLHHTRCMAELQAAYRFQIYRERQYCEQH